MKKAVRKQVHDANFFVVRKTLITFTIAMSLGFSSTIANAQDATTDPSPVVEAEVTQTEQTTQNTTSDATMTGSDEAKSSSNSQETKPEAPAASEAEAETTSDEGLVAEKPEVDPSSQIKDQLSSSKLNSKDEKSADKDKANKTEEKSEDKSEISDNSSSLSSKKDEKKPAGITQTADEANKSQQASSNPALRVAGVIAGIVGVLGLIGGGIFWALQQNLINIPGLPNPFAPKPAPAPAPAPAPQPAPAPAPAQNQPARQAQAQAQPVRHQAPAPAASGKRYKNCRAVWNELGRPIRSNEPGYGRHLDRDGDGVGCERRPR